MSSSPTRVNQLPSSLDVLNYHCAHIWVAYRELILLVTASSVALHFSARRV